MTSNAYFLKENELVQGEVGALGCHFVGGDKKDIVLTKLYQSYPNSVAIYGWQWLNGTNIQPLFLGFFFLKNFNFFFL